MHRIMFCGLPSPIPVWLWSSTAAVQLPPGGVCESDNILPRELVSISGCFGHEHSELSPWWFKQVKYCHSFKGSDQDFPSRNFSKSAQHGPTKVWLCRRLPLRRTGFLCFQEGAGWAKHGHKMEVYVSKLLALPIFFRRVWSELDSPEEKNRWIGKVKRCGEKLLWFYDFCYWYSTS